MDSPGKITSVTAMQPPTPGAPRDWRTQLGQIVVRVETDAGQVGLGVGGGGQAGVHVVQTVLSDVLLGQDAANVEGLHADMHAATVFFGRKGIVVMAISGVDLALWDLRGKQQRTPIAELLAPGSSWDRALPTYCTVFDDQEAESAFTAGHQALKLHVERFGDRPQGSEIAELVSRVRDRLGTQAMVMIDAFGRWDLSTTCRVADSLAGLDVAWLEEPLPPDDLAGYAQLAKDCPVPIAGGEHEYTVAGFRELIERRLHAVLQPDVNWCGGLTTLREIYSLAQQAGIRVCPHRGCEPFALPAIAALDEAPLAESPRRWFDCLAGASEIQAGRIRPNSEPGFGITLRPQN